MVAATERKDVERDPGAEEEMPVQEKEQVKKLQDLKLKVLVHILGLLVRPLVRKQLL